MALNGPTLLWNGTGEITVDIWFVHGLRGDAIETWSKGTTCWPKDLLPVDIPNSRVFTWGYDSSVLNATQAASQASIFAHAENFLNDISRSRRTGDEEGRPLILVGHSLGGLVIKEALIRSSEYYHNGQDKALGGIFARTEGTVFIGTPHRGTAQASMGSIAASIAKAVGFRPNNRMVTLLEQESPILERQRRTFASISRDLPIVYVFEEMATKWGMIVPEHSASIDGYNVRLSSVPADHLQMCKFGSKDDIGYQRISGHLLAFAREAARGINQELDRNVQLIKNLLQNLAFNTMDDRENAMEPAHENTFQWLLGESSPLVRWLRTDGPLFWISGKAGSGKSTLMRTLFRNREMEGIVRHHFADNNVLLARYYFYDQGRDLLQKSQEGLLRALLHQLISQESELGPLLFGPRKLENAFWQPGKAWRWSDLKTAFETLLKEKADDVQLVLFVDGLDEYRSLDRYDTCDYYDDDDSARARMIADGHDRIGEIFKKACQFPKVKICVASRPLLRFKDRFERFPHIKLHELTANDISAYVKTRLGSNEQLACLTVLEPSLSSSLVQDIVDRASGVFLWVRLVVDILIRGLTDRDGVEELRSKVGTMPPELGGRNGLYMKMLKDLSPKYRLQGYKIFQIMLSVDPSKKLELEIDLLTLALSEMSMQSVTKASVASMSLFDAECEQLRKNMEGRLLSRCAGLLESQPFSPRGDLVNMWWLKDVDSQVTARFLHRTAKDFVVEAENWDLLLPATSQALFDPHEAILGGFILLIGSFRQDKLPLSRRGIEHMTKPRSNFHNGSEFRLPQTSEWVLLQTALHHALKSELTTGKSPVALIDCLDRTMQRVAGIGRHWAALERNTIEMLNTDRDMLAIAVQANLSLYLKAKLSDGIAKYTRQPSRRPLLSYALAPDRVPGSMKIRLGDLGVWQSSPSVTQTLLECGFDPNEQYHGPMYHYKCCSVWQATLAYGELCRQRPKDWRCLQPETDVERWLENARLLVRHGADVNVEAGEGREAAPRSALCTVTWLAMQTESTTDYFAGIVQDMLSKDAVLLLGERNLLSRLAAKYLLHVSTSVEEKIADMPEREVREGLNQFWPGVTTIRNQ